MRLVETKTYKIDIASTEKENFRNMAEKLVQIEYLFAGRQIFYRAAEDDCDYEMTSAEIEDMVKFLYALVYDDVKVL